MAADSGTGSGYRRKNKTFVTPDLTVSGEEKDKAHLVKITIDSQHRTD